MPPRPNFNRKFLGLDTGVAGPMSTNIEDRRPQEPYLAPRAPDAVLRGMPATPYEWQMYQSRIAANEAIKAGRPPEPVYAPPGAEPSEGDPAAIEARRRMNAAKAIYDKYSNRQ